MSDSILPVIDLRKAKGSGRVREREKLLDALTTTGFFYLKGIDGVDSNELLELTKWVFNIQKEKKMSITTKMFDKNSTNWYRGYFPVQPEAVSYKEGFEVGPSSFSFKPTGKEEVLCSQNQWPHGEAANGISPDVFKEKIEKIYLALTEGGIETMRLIAEALSIESEFFTKLFRPDQLSTFRLLHYPSRKSSPPPESIDGDYVLVCSEHKDSGFLTLLSTFDYGGLQIRNDENQWVDVPKKEDCLVVNIGQLLSTMSGGVLKATNHRVIDTGEDRYSVPFFLEPGFRANVNIRLTPLQNSDSESSAAGLTDNPGDHINYGEWVIDMMSQFAEYEIFRIWSQKGRSN